VKVERLNTQTPPRSLATAQVSLAESRSRYPLWPPRFQGAAEPGAAGAAPAQKQVPACPRTRKGRSHLWLLP